VYRLTDSVRVDHVVEVGAGTLEKSIRAVRYGDESVSLACYQAWAADLTTACIGQERHAARDLRLLRRAERRLPGITRVKKIYARRVEAFLKTVV